MILTITTHAHELVQSDECQIYILEEAKGTLWSPTATCGTKASRIPTDQGIMGGGGSLRQVEYQWITLGRVCQV